MSGNSRRRIDPSADTQAVGAFHSTKINNPSIRPASRRLFSGLLFPVPMFQREPAGCLAGAKVVERESVELSGAAEKANVPDRGPFAGDVELSDRLDPSEPAVVEVGVDRAVVHRDEDAVAANPFVGLAPEGETPRIAVVIAEHRRFRPPRGEGELAAVEPVAGEQERVRAIEQPSTIQLSRDLVPADRVDRRVA